MHKRVNSLFGDEAVHSIKESDMGGEHKTLWESLEKDSAGNSKLRIEVTSRECRLKEVKVREMIDGKPIMTKFDSSYKLWGGEASPNEDYARVAERHRQNIPDFLRSIISAHNISESPIEVFFPLFMREAGHAEKKELKKPAPRVFTQMVKIQEHQPDSFSINFPTEVADTMGLKGGRQVAWTAEGKSIILTPLEGIHYSVEVRKQGGEKHPEFSIALPAELVISMKWKPQIYMDWSVEGEKLELKPAEGAPRDATKLQLHKYDETYSIDIPTRLFEHRHLKPGMRGEWFADGEKLIVELKDDYPDITRISQPYGRYVGGVYVSIPKNLTDTVGLKKGMEVGFRINEKGQLVITPKKSELLKRLD
jgi:bifunctional DNA-binding transcriptional regulator/antitoxin component of YhaV-PrlF toxin-antitoxin module